MGPTYQAVEVNDSLLFPHLFFRFPRRGDLHSSHVSTRGSIGVGEGTALVRDLGLHSPLQALLPIWPARRYRRSRASPSGGQPISAGRPMSPSWRRELFRHGMARGTAGSSSGRRRPPGELGDARGAWALPGVRPGQRQQAVFSVGNDFPSEKPQLESEFPFPHCRRYPSDRAFEFELGACRSIAQPRSVE